MPDARATLAAYYAAANAAHQSAVAANRAAGRPADENTGGRIWHAGDLWARLQDYELDDPIPFFEDYPEEVSDGNS